ncbi:hypothetical protein [Enterococcus dongliensis]|nr:hypothetical protein [Enterococcus dongliensis]MDT2702993.1 hypothetical protein [Enterococcus dongliensis]
MINKEFFSNWSQNPISKSKQEKNYDPRFNHRWLLFFGYAYQIFNDE